jgi:capsular polysaccharide transport system permease protein
VTSAIRNAPGEAQGGKPQRTSLQVTLSVWKALLLREAMMRLFSSRGAWFWLLLEPVWHIGYMVLMFAVVRVRHIGGIETTVWIMAGLLCFFAFRRAAQQCMNAVNANSALYTYRQVKPIDAVLTRGLLEGMLAVVTTVILVSLTAMAGIDVVPDDPFAVLQVFFGMWLIGVGFGLTASVAVELAPEAGRVIGMVMTPLYFASGVIFPIGVVGPPYREWLMLNPLAHGLEAARKGFADHYHQIPETSMSYFYGSALVILFFGLALHRRYASKMLTQ